MRAGRTLLDPTDVQGGAGELHLGPAQVRQFRRPQAMPIGHKDHRCVPMAPTVSLGRCHQPLDLCLSKVLASAEVGVGEPRGRDCSFYGSWRDQLEARFGHVLGFLGLTDCWNNTPYSNSMQRRNVRSDCQAGLLDGPAKPQN